MKDLNDLIVLDCEVYPNYFLIAMKSLDTGKLVTIESKGREGQLSADDRQMLHKIMGKKITFGFNSLHFDMPVLCLALQNATCEQIHALCNDIIVKRMMPWQVTKKYNINIPHGYDHFDIIQPAPAINIGLKLYGARMHCPTVQDLPIKPGSTLTADEMLQIKTYCGNDLDTTIELYKDIEKPMQLRVELSRKYNVDLRSKSDAQIAEAAIKAELERIGHVNIHGEPIDPSTTFKYKPPEYIEFDTQELHDALKIIKGAELSLDTRGAVALPAELKELKLKFGYSTYQMGGGGLHSCEKSQTIEPNENQLLVDRDVASYYPRIILNLGLSPEHLGDNFLKIYGGIVDDRLAAKAAGDKTTADSLKIVINGTFGKLGSKYSKLLYSPALMMQVTLTGQLALLMLIEQLELNGISVVSANTDGFVSLMDKSQYDLYDSICQRWQEQTKFDLEETRYSGLYSRDVNNYMAVTTDGEVKGKGVFTKPSTRKSPHAYIVSRAVIELVTKGTPIASYITDYKDKRDFIIARTVKGGAVWHGGYLGKVVRWVRTKTGESIHYELGGNKVAMSDSATPVMRLEQMPTDIDYDWYIHAANSLLDDIGYFKF